jgi:hypothetical protein
MELHQVLQRIFLPLLLVKVEVFDLIRITHRLKHHPALMELVRYIPVVLEHQFLVLAGSGSNHVVIWKYITGTDRHTVRAQTVLRLDASFNSFPAISVLARIFYAYFLLVKNIR